MHQNPVNLFDFKDVEQRPQIRFVTITILKTHQ